MLDLLPLVLEEPAQGESEHAEPALRVETHAAYPSHEASFADARPSEREELTGKNGSGLLSNFKKLVVNGRRRSDSSVPKAVTARGSGSGSLSLEEFAPLRRGENGAGSGHLPSDQPPAREEISSPREQTFMDKVKAYRTRKSKGSKSGDLSGDGPLGQGVNRQAGEGNDARPEGDSRYNEGLQEFFVEVAEAKDLLAEILQSQKLLSKEREAARSLISAKDVQDAQEHVRDAVQDVTLLCKKVKLKLDGLDGLNAALLENDEEDEELPDSAAVQMRLSVMAGLHAKLAEVTASWQETQALWVAEDRQEVALQLHTVTGRHFEPEAVEDLILQGGAEQIYRQALTSISGASVQQAMTAVQQRHDQMRQLEASMLELHQAFLDMSILVADQGDTINKIDNWVCLTSATMQESLRQLRRAKSDRRKAAQTKAITFVTGVGLVAGGAGLTATGVGAVAGIPMIIAGAAAVGGSAIGGIT